MAVLRRVNLLSQQRIDLNDLKSIESASSNDFDDLMKSFVTGTDHGFILRGFELSMSGAIGGAATGLAVSVDPGAVMHINSSQSGTMYLVPTGMLPQQLNASTNPLVDGSFTPSAINYIGLEYERYLDTTTDSQVYLWDPTTKAETTKTAPRAQVLRFRLKISSTIPASNILPIAIVTTDASSNVISVTDARFRLFSLGQGGFSPNPTYQYPWTAQSEGRTANPVTSTSDSVNPFHGGDKMLGTLKDWMDAIMTELQGVKGTPYWFSTSTSGSLQSLREDLGNTVITGRGYISHSKTTPGLINWSSDIVVRVIGSSLAYTIAANPTSTNITLTDDQAAYITLIRGQGITPNLIFTNNGATVSSVGSVAWTAPLVAGDWIKLASSTDQGYYKIQSIDSTTQVTLATPFTGQSTGASGTQAQYAFGSYQSSATPSTNRHIYIAPRSQVPSGEDTFWMFLRSDNGGSTGRVYIRFLGSEIEQGVSEEISDNVPLQLFEYIGSASESSSQPQYVASLNSAAVPKISNILFGAASTIASNEYFTINSSGNSRVYYAWFNKDGTGSDPAPGNTNASVKIVITTGMTDIQVAAAVATALNGTSYGDFEAVQLATPNANTLQVTNASAGACQPPANYNVGAPFTVTVEQNGVGTGNIIITDGDNLTLAIKKLDEAMGGIYSALDTPSYDESADVVTSGGTPPSTINGPVTAGAQVQLPFNSRLGDVVQKYTVGKGTLVINLNGIVQRQNTDWFEVGSTGQASSYVTFARGLLVGDSIGFRISGLGGGSGGGGGQEGPPGPAGLAGPAGHDAVGGPVNVATKTASYTVSLSNNILRANAASNAIVFTLPSAASAVGHVFYFKKVDSSLNPMTIQANGSETIDGSNTQSTTVQYETFMLVSNGTSWDIY